MDVPILLVFGLGVHCVDLSASNAVTPFSPCAEVNTAASFAAKRTKRIGRGIYRRVPTLRAAHDSGHGSQVAVDQFEIDILFIKAGTLHTARQDEANIQGIFIGTDFRYAGQLMTQN